MTRKDGTPEAAGEPARHLPVLLAHVPVLLAEVREALKLERGGVFVDATFGAGGYTRAILDAPGTRVVAIDRDPDAVAAGAALARQMGERLRLVLGRFGDLAAIADGEAVAGVVLDVGVSSMQIDAAERGFSFRHDGPLDMRMERNGPSAADLVNDASETELADIFFHFGEERRARAVARAIVEARRRAPIATTAELADLVAAHVRAEPGGQHPATRVFQGLRIAVNDELGELVRALHAAEAVLEEGGRLAVVTFHSLEDRIVKQFFAARSARSGGGSRHLPHLEAAPPSFQLVTRGPVAPAESEIARNPRARSAKLRVAERTMAPPQQPLHAVQVLAELPGAAGGRGGRR